jgi:hypothetical protein
MEGLGDGDAVRPGLRKPRRLDIRLADLAVGGTGDVDGSRGGIVDEGRVPREGAVCLRNEGVQGLYLCPTSRSLVFVLVFHRGRLSNAGESAGCAGCAGFRAAGVGDGAVSVVLGVALGLLGFLPVRLEASCGSPETRRPVDVRAAEPTELPRRLDLLAGVMTTDDAGELPGVSARLPVAGLSIVRTVEMESRICCDLKS